MMRRSALIFIFISGLAADRLQAQELNPPRFEWKGYVKDLPGLTSYGAFDSSDVSNLVHVRIDLKARLSERLHARAGLRTRLYTGSLVRHTPGFASAVAETPGWRGPSGIWLDKAGAVGHTAVDRLDVRYPIRGWDVTLGRQRINWGVHNVWNPNDIFNAYNFLDFDYEERPGSDAVRLQRQLSGDAGIELAWAPGRDRHRHIAAMLYRWNRKGYDLQGLAGIFRGDIVVGAGWAGGIGENGFKGEASYFHPRLHWTDTIGTLTASLMADRTFKGDWYLSAGFLYNSHPTGGLGSGALSPMLTAKSLFPFRYSGLVSGSKSFATVHTISLSVVAASTDATLLLLPSYAWSVSDAFDLDAVVQSFLSDAGGRWRMQGAAFFLRGRWSF
jgi:hypothetical protein